MVKATAYTCIFRPLFEYASSVWVLVFNQQLEAVQHQAARWVCGSHWNTTQKRWSKSSDSCLDQLNWPSLHDRQKYFTLCQLHSILSNYLAIPFNEHFPGLIDILVQILS